MILKLVDGPMDGAVYPLSRDRQHTTRKPDGVWFDSFECSTGRPMREEYKYEKCEDLGEGMDRGSEVALVFRYDGQCVDTGIEMRTEEKPE